MFKCICKQLCRTLSGASTVASVRGQYGGLCPGPIQWPPSGASTVASVWSQYSGLCLEPIEWPVSGASTVAQYRQWPLSGVNTAAFVWGQYSDPCLGSIELILPGAEPIHWPLDQCISLCVCHDSRICPGQISLSPGSS